MTNPLALLLPKPDVEVPSYRWATVTQDNPLRVLLDGDSQPLPIAPASLTYCAVGDRVLCLIDRHRLTVVGNRAESGRLGTILDDVASARQDIDGALQDVAGLQQDVGSLQADVQAIGQWATPDRAVAIGSVDSLDTYTTPGFYYQSSSSAATPARGYPTPYGGALLVEATAAPGGGWVTQTYKASASAGSAEVWVRNASGVGAGGSWTGWTRLSAGRVASGSVIVTPPAANSPGSTHVTFPSGLFTSAPAVTVTPGSGVPGTQALGTGVTAISTSGCTVWFTRTNTTATTVYWVAVQT